MRFIILFLGFISINSNATELKIISYNLGTRLFKSNKKAIEKINEVIDYYQADIHLYQNSFNRSIDILKTNPLHPYFNYDIKEKKKTSNAITTTFPIINEKYETYNNFCSLWKSYGVSSFELKLPNDKRLMVFNTSIPTKERRTWNYIADLERVIKTSALDNQFILTVEFNRDMDQEILDSLKNRLNLTDIVKKYVQDNNLDELPYRTGVNKKRKIRSNYLFLGNIKETTKILDSYPVFNGEHDENRYLKDAGILYHIDL